MTALTAKTLAGLPYVASLQVDLTGETSLNSSWSIVGKTSDGIYTWEVRGGTGKIKDGSVSLFDPDVPLGVPVVWTLTTPRGKYATKTTTIAGPKRGYGVIGPVTGRDLVVFKHLHTLDEQEMKPRFEMHEIAGRARPAIRRDEVAGDGGGSMEIETDPVNTALLKKVIRANEQVTFRTSGYLLDKPLVEHMFLTSVPQKLNRKNINRVWDIEYEYVDFFPYAATPAPVITVGEIAKLRLTVGGIAAKNLTVGQIAAGALIA